MYYISIVKENKKGMTYFYNAKENGWTPFTKNAIGFANKKYAEILKTAIELHTSMNLEVIYQVN